MTGFTGNEWESLTEGYLKEFGNKEQIVSEISSLFNRLSKTLEKKTLCFFGIPGPLKTILRRTSSP